MVELATRSPLQKLYHTIKTLANLAPSPEVNAAFGELVPTAINPNTNLDLDKDQIKFMQQACSNAETLLERYWARDIVSSRNPKERLEQFPYIDNYYDLAKMEKKIIDQYSPKKMQRGSTITFVGGGLPFTSYVLAKEYGIQSIILDNDPEAADLANSLVRKIGMQDMMHIEHSGGEQFNGYGNLTIVAALAGMADEVKIKILKQIRDTAPLEGHILARTIEPGTAREVLYAPLPKQTDSLFQRIALVHPSQTPGSEKVVNSVALYQTTNIPGLKDAA